MKLHIPIEAKHFVLTQKFLNPDPKLYPKTGVHPGCDYGTKGDPNVYLYYVADGEVIDRGTDSIFGNWFFYYVPELNVTFAYFHLAECPPPRGAYKAGEVPSVCGSTGLSTGIHLHLEAYRGKKYRRDRIFNSKADIERLCFDADKYLRSQLNMV
jgi:murein DD-endopeptidase MepM/ murein hydrolase activator NlpD